MRGGPIRSEARCYRGRSHPSAQLPIRRGASILPNVLVVATLPPPYKHWSEPDVGGERDEAAPAPDGKRRLTRLLLLSRTTASASPTSCETVPGDSPWSS